MDQSQLEDLEQPRIETGRAMLIAGISERCTEETSTRIPAMWQRFAPHIGNIPSQAGNVAYGVVFNAGEDGTTDYLCGVEVSSFSLIPQDWTRLNIPERRYAVFTHSSHISEIRRTWFSIWNQWTPKSGNEPSGGPEFERYGENFNPVTGFGGVEIWIPIRQGAG